MCAGLFGQPDFSQVAPNRLLTPLLNLILGQHDGLIVATACGNRFYKSNRFGVPVGDTLRVGAELGGLPLRDGRHDHIFTARGFNCFELAGRHRNRIGAAGGAVNLGNNLGIYSYRGAGLHSPIDSYFFRPGFSSIKSSRDIIAICSDGVAGHLHFRGCHAETGRSGVQRRQVSVLAIPVDG